MKNFKFLFLIIFLFAAVSMSFIFKKPNQSIHEQPLWIKELSPHLEEQINQYANPKGVVGVAIKDLTTGEFFSMNGNVSFNPASVIKIPVMVEAYHQVSLGKISLEDRLVLKDKYKLTGSGSLQYFRTGNEFSIRRLIELMITDSDNTATYMLIDKLGMANINEFMKKIGLGQTCIKDPTMLSKDLSKQNSTTPENMLTILEKLYNGEIISKEFSEEMLAVMKRQRHKWGIARYLPKNVTIANKTGSLDYVRNDVGIVLNDNPYIISIFSKNLPSNKDGSILVGTLSKEVFDNRRLYCLNSQG